jgi:hypothetical protein
MAAVIKGAVHITVTYYITRSSVALCLATWHARRRAGGGDSEDLAAVSVCTPCHCHCIRRAALLRRGTSIHGVHFREDLLGPALDGLDRPHRPFAGSEEKNGSLVDYSYSLHRLEGWN